MKKSALLIHLIFLFTMSSAIGQNDRSNDQVCKAPPSHPSAMKRLVKEAQAHKRSMNTLYIPLTINLVGTNEGGGFYTQSNVRRALCQLNEDFHPYDFHFYVADVYNYISNSDFYQMSDEYSFSPDLDQYISSQNTENTLNIYIVDRTSTSGGFSYLHWPLYDTLDIEVPWVTNFPQDHAVVVRKTHLANVNSHLLTHEIGHYFSLWHTFFGWEGINHQNLDSIPDSITIGDSTFSFQVKVERVDGVDCDDSGDFICDTPPDYLSAGFTCNENMESPIVQFDPDSVEFRSDGTYFMSYSNNDCQSQFSQGQVDIMRYFAENTRNYLLFDQTQPDSFLVEDLILIYPSDGAAAVTKNDSVTLTWDMPGATQYYLTYGYRLGINFYLPVESEIRLTESQYEIHISNFNREYYWIVRAESNYYHCQESVDTSYFELGLVSTGHIDPNEALEIYPNPSSDLIHISGMEYESVQIFDQLGRLVSDKPISVDQLDISDLMPGIYFVRIKMENGFLTRRLMKQE